MDNSIDRLADESQESWPFLATESDDCPTSGIIHTDPESSQEPGIHYGRPERIWPILQPPAFCATRENFVNVADFIAKWKVTHPRAAYGGSRGLVASRTAEAHFAKVAGSCSTDRTQEAPRSLVN